MDRAQMTCFIKFPRPQRGRSPSATVPRGRTGIELIRSGASSRGGITRPEGERAVGRATRLKHPPALGHEYRAARQLHRQRNQLDTGAARGTVATVAALAVEELDETRQSRTIHLSSLRRWAKRSLRLRIRGLGVRSAWAALASMFELPGEDEHLPRASEAPLLGCRVDRLPAETASRHFVCPIIVGFSPAICQVNC